MKDSFYGKTWIFRAQVFVLGFFSFFGLTMGPAFLMKWIEPNNGKEGTVPGIALILVGIFLLIPSSVGIFNLIARRKPIVRICRDGLEIRIIGKRPLGDLPLVPVFIRLLWGFFSGAVFSVEQFRIEWGQLRQVNIQRAHMMNTIVFSGMIERCGWESAFGVKQEYATIALPDWQFKDSLQGVVLSVRTFASDRSMQLSLESWTKADF